MNFKIFIPFAFCLILSEAVYINVTNNGVQDVVLFVHVDGFDPDNFGIVEAGRNLEIATLDEWTGEFYVYPEECLNITCSYLVTRVRTAFSEFLFDSFYDFLVVDISQAFSVPARIRSLTNPDCGVAICSANLLEDCPEENQILDGNGQLISCRTSSNNYLHFQEACPQAVVDSGADLDLIVCKSADYEIVFG